MPNYLADTRTNGAVTDLHVGLNCIVSKATISETLSGSMSVELAVIPGGGRITRVHFLNHGGGTAGGVVTIAAGGNAYMTSATNAASVLATGSGLGDRLTSDATLTLVLNNLSGDGEASTPITVITEYLTDLVRD